MREFLLRRIDKCIDCSSCINACKRRHKKSRMTMDGITFDCISLPNTCKSCPDPDCVKACRKGAMLKKNDRIFVDPEKCVGCGLCKKACPYDAIVIIERTDLEKKGFFRRRKTEEKKKKRAFKCDLCIDFENSACVDACPTKALERFEVEFYQGDNCEDIVKFLNASLEKSKKN